MAVRNSSKKKTARATSPRSTGATRAIPKGALPVWKDGRIDPDWLGAAGRNFVRGWLRDRLEGRDAYQPIDVRVDEDPEAFLVELLRDVGAQHEAFKVIAASALSLLDDVRKVAAKPPAYFSRLLSLCQWVAIPQVRPWFAEEVDQVASGEALRWKGQTLHEVLYAATVQKAGSAASWERLLENPRHATLALLALAPTFRECGRYLPRWWAALGGVAGKRELDQLLRAALREHEEREVRDILLAEREILSGELREAIDTGMRKLGRNEVFGARSLRGPSFLRNAAYRSELLLQLAG